MMKFISAFLTMSFLLMIFAGGIDGVIPIPIVIGIFGICFFLYWRAGIRKSSGIDKIFKPIPEEPEKSKSVVITSDGEVIRTLDDGTVKSTSNTDKTITDENNIMWAFKLKKTRIILIISILWIVILYFGILFDSYYDIDEWTFFFLWGTPVWIYWVVIPSYRWVMKGK